MPRIVEEVLFAQHTTNSVESVSGANDVKVATDLSTGEFTMNHMIEEKPKKNKAAQEMGRLSAEKRKLPSQFFVDMAKKSWENKKDRKHRTIYFCAWEGKIVEANSTYYMSGHKWISRHFGKPNKCDDCGIETGKFDWVMTKPYLSKIREDWRRLCKKCHKKYDIERSKLST